MSGLRCVSYVLMFLAVGFVFGACEEFPHDLPVGTYRFVETHQRESAWYETNAMEFSFDDEARLNNNRGSLKYYIGQTTSQGSRDKFKAGKADSEFRCFAPYDYGKFFFDRETQKVSFDFSAGKEVNPYADKIKSVKYDGWENTLTIELRERISIFGDRLSFKLVYKAKPMWDGMI